MRIAICTDQYLPMLSGLVDVVHALQKELRSRGHVVRIYTPMLPNAQEDPEVYRFPGRIIAGSIVLSVPSGAMRDMRRFKPDVVHTHLFGMAGFLAWYAARWFNIPLIGTDHTFPADYLHYLHLNFPPLPYVVRRYASWYYNRCDIVTAPSTSMLSELKDYGLRRPSIIVPNPVPDFFRPMQEKAALKKKYGITGSAVLIFGRLAQEKNLDIAVDAYRDVASRTDAELVFLGDGPYRETLLGKLRAYGLTSRARFLGALRGEPLAEAVNACDVCLITSTSETQSMTTIQSLACGIPVVAANAGGLPEYVHDGETGYLVAPAERALFADRMVAILKDTALRERMGATGLKSVERFSAASIAKQYEAVYSEAIRTR